MSIFSQYSKLAEKHARTVEGAKEILADPEACDELKKTAQVTLSAIDQLTIEQRCERGLWYISQIRDLIIGAVKEGIAVSVLPPSVDVESTVRDGKSRHTTMLPIPHINETSEYTSYGLSASVTWTDEADSALNPS